MSSGVSSWGRMCWTRWLTYITTGLSVGLVFILGLFLLQFLTLKTYAFAFGGILIVIFVSYWLVRLAVVEQVAFCEHVSGVTAMRRSFELTRGRFWQVFLLWLVVVALDITAIAFYLPSIFTPALDNWIVDAIVGTIADVVLAFGELCLFSTYLCLSQSRDIDEPEFPANTPVVSVANSANPYEPPSAT
jgi:hypothetical protein